MVHKGTFYIAQNDTRDVVRGFVKDDDGVAVDLTGCTVSFRMKSKDGITAVDSDAVIVNAPSGEVQYDWAAADTAEAGTFYAKFLFLDGTQTFSAPNDGYIKVVITKDIDPLTP